MIWVDLKSHWFLLNIIWNNQWAANENMPMSWPTDLPSFISVHLSLHTHLLDYKTETTKFTQFSSEFLSQNSWRRISLPVIYNLWTNLSITRSTHNIPLLYDLIFPPVLLTEDKQKLCNFSFLASLMFCGNEHILESVSLPGQLHPPTFSLVPVPANDQNCSSTVDACVVIKIYHTEPANQSGDSSTPLPGSTPLTSTRQSAPYVRCHETLTYTMRQFTFIYDSKTLKHTLLLTRGWKE